MEFPELTRKLALPLLVAALASGVSEKGARADEATAQALFDEAKRLADAGDFAAACPKYEESQKAAAGIGTLYRLGDCYEHIGRLASAWGAFTDVAGQAKARNQPDRAADANDRATKLFPRLSRLTINVATGNTVPVTVKRDGVEVGQASWGLPIPVDAGEHAITASAAGKKTIEGRVTVAGEGTTVGYDIPVLEDGPPEPAPVPSIVVVEPPPPKSAEKQAAERDNSEARRNRLALAAVVGGVGVVGVGVGSVFGILALTRDGQSNKSCASTATTCSSTSAVDDRNTARSEGNVSTIGFAVGGVGLLAGAILWLTAPSATVTESAKAPRFTLGPLVGAGATGLVGRGSF